MATSARGISTHSATHIERHVRAFLGQNQQIRTFAVERTGKRLSRAAPEEITQVIEGLNEIIGTQYAATPEV